MSKHILKADIYYAIYEYMLKEEEFIDCRSNSLYIPNFINLTIKLKVFIE